MKNWDLLTIERVWQKASLLPGSEHLSHLVRMDEYGNRIERSAYGDYRSPVGWEIDHWWPTKLGGTDELSNLRPLKCSANRQKQDSVPFPFSGQWSDEGTQEHPLYGKKSIWPGWWE